jgi:hypothetical protein
VSDSRVTWPSSQCHPELGHSVNLMQWSATNLKQQRLNPPSIPPPQTRNLLVIRLRCGDNKRPGLLRVRFSAFCYRGAKESQERKTVCTLTQIYRSLSWGSTRTPASERQARKPVTAGILRTRESNLVPPDYSRRRKTDICVRVTKKITRQKGKNLDWQKKRTKRRKLSC